MVSVVDGTSVGSTVYIGPIYTMLCGAAPDTEFPMGCI